MKALIIDGYVDEPACLGVPPYISPYPRYIAGVFKTFDFEVNYITIDQYRKQKELYTKDIIPSSKIVVIIAGLTVPGHYLGGTPLTYRELVNILTTLEKYRTTTFVGGPISRGYALKGGVCAIPLDALPWGYLIKGDPEATIYSYLENKEIKSDTLNIKRNYKQLRSWAKEGAFIITQHPNFPYIMCEIETSRGCDRTTHCSFCTEPLYGKPTFRPPQDIVEEIKKLYENGARYFRLGRQANILTYMGEKTKGSFKPNPKAIKELYEGIRKAAPNLKVLHLDNGNPLTIATFPDESALVLEEIVKHNTPGDVLAFGIESTDPDVIKINNLKVTPEQALFAIKVVNEIGAKREGRSMPKLLPGLNFIAGLAGDSNKTLEHNYKFLKTVLENNLMVRRINLRQAIVFEDTTLKKLLKDYPSKIKALKYKQWKRKIREEIDNPMLKKVAPIGTILNEVIIEKHEGQISFGRQIATYPLLVGIPQKVNLKSTVDVAITGYGFRSITGVPYPLDINKASLSTLQALPGIGKARAKKIIEKRPILSEKDLINIIEDKATAKKLIQLYLNSV